MGAAAVILALAVAQAAPPAATALHAGAAGHAEALLVQARQALADKRHSEAADLYARAIDADPASLREAWGWGMALYGRGDMDGAAAVFERVLAAAPGSARALYGRALVHMRTGRPAEAEADLRAVLALDSDDVRARFRLGQLLQARGETAQAVAELRAALARRFFHQPARHALILALRDGGRADATRAAEARAEAEVFRRVEGLLPHIRRAEVAVRAAPDDAAARTRLAELYRRAGKASP